MKPTTTTILTREMDGDGPSVVGLKKHARKVNKTDLQKELTVWMEALTIARKKDLTFSAT